MIMIEGMSQKQSGFRNDTRLDNKRSSGVITDEDCRTPSPRQILQTGDRKVVEIKGKLKKLRCSLGKIDLAAHCSQLRGVKLKGIRR